MSTICNSYKAEVLRGAHKPDHDYRLALFVRGLDASTTNYSVTGEVKHGAGYVRGGKPVTGFNVGLDGSEAWLSFGGPVRWDNSEITANMALLYNNSLPGKPAVCVLTFDKEVRSVNGPFTVHLPDRLVRFV